MVFSVIGTSIEDNVKVYINDDERLQSLYIIGSTGTAKTGLIEN